MRRSKRMLVVIAIFMASVMGVAGIGANSYVLAASGKAYVKREIKKIKNKYPDGSTYNHTFEYYDPGMDATIISSGGCNGFVAYVTKRIYGSVFTEWGDYDYKVVGDVSTSSIQKMKKLFKKAKIGDPIVWYTENDCRHMAIFMSCNSKGIRVYEANFGGKNKVRYNHQWDWKYMKSWPKGGAKRVLVEHYRGYNSLGDE